ncbi:MAG: ribosome biogenesis GTPase YlqF [Pseudomonadota bacterium]
MQIQWFPGHMHKARKELARRLNDVDLVIEMLDARIPFSSENPMLAELRGDKPCLKVLTKIDLADPFVTEQSIPVLEQSSSAKVVCIDTTDSISRDTVITACKSIAPNTIDAVRGIQTLVAGIPNVGKSTLINLLAGRAIANTGDEPAITKRQQRVDLQNGVVIFDSPGVLWPNLENPNGGVRLAISGAIRNTAFSYLDVAPFLAELLRDRYPDCLHHRFAIADVNHTGDAIIEMIGKARGCLVRGGTVDAERAATILINEYQSGKLGRITLETPQDHAAELEHVAIRREEKAAKKAARAAAKKERRVR